MNSIVLVNILRFTGLILLQILVFRQMNYGPFMGAYFRIFMYPLFLLLLPFRLSTELLMLIGFGTGLVVDMAYDTIGIHASTAVALMAVRAIILNQIKPKGGYTLNKGLTPDNYGWNWFARYIFFAFIVFSLWLSILEVFNIVQIGQILMRAILIIPASLFFIFISVQVLNPRN